MMSSVKEFPLLPPRWHRENAKISREKWNENNLTKSGDKDLLSSGVLDADFVVWCYLPQQTLETRGEGRLVEARVCRVHRRQGSGELAAIRVSESLPFMVCFYHANRKYLKIVVTLSEKYPGSPLCLFIAFCNVGSPLP